MKITRIHKCAQCNEKNPFYLIRCKNTLVNGCDQEFCLPFHWGAHAEMHQKEWDNATRVQRKEWWEKCYPNTPYPEYNNGNNEK